MRDKLLNQCFGRLTVLRYAGLKDHGSYKRHRWECQCKCGSICEVNELTLLNGQTRSCGCLHKENAKQQGKSRSLPEGEAALRNYFYIYRRSAKIRKLAFDLDESSFRKLVANNCHYCGCGPYKLHPASSYGEVNGRVLVNGLDRVDNNQGYLLSNVVTCCEICNYAKRNLSLDEFTTWLQQIKDRYKHE